MNNCIDLGKTTLKHLIVSKPTKTEPVTPASPPVKQTVPSDIDREPYMTDTETSGDLTSRETTPSLDAELVGEEASDRVDLSLWLQWTLPKFEISFYKLSEARKQGNYTLSK